MWELQRNLFGWHLRALIIKEKLGTSDRETIEQIRENPYLQYFICMTSYLLSSTLRLINVGSFSTENRCQPEEIKSMKKWSKSRPKHQAK
ncbi:transposase [Tychonema sp. LEGE 07199]|nr:transposase [Tychonema sp. LEGE 07199]MBE9134466.1 transposase [Tychonema sp. LEGE 07196]